MSSIGLLLLIASLVVANEDVAEKVDKLVSMNANEAVIRLNFKNFKELVKSSPRNYSIMLLLTAQEASRECEICAMAGPEYETVAKSWLKSSEYSSNKLFFTLVDVDFEDGVEVFKSLGLGHAPVLMHFPMKGKPKPVDTFDAQKNGGYSAEMLIKWINDRTGVQVHIYKAPDYSKLIIAGAIAVLALTVIILKGTSIFQLFFNRSLWSVLAISFILTFLSGQMWNSIRAPPFARNNPRTGRKSLVAPSNSYQFVAETYIVVGLYTAIALGFIIINEAVKFNRKLVKILFMLLGVTISALFFSALLFIFEAKFQGYPYGLSNLIKIEYQL